MPPELILGLFNVFAPIIKGIIAKHQAAHNGAMPTDADILAAFQGNIAAGLAEGAEWRRTHPNA